MRKTIIILLLLIFLSFNVMAQSPVEVTTPERTGISVRDTITGNFSAFKKVNIPAEIGGIVDQITVSVGDDVSQDQKLLQLNQDKLNIQIKQAEAALDAARANYQQLKNGASQEEINRAQASYDQAQASLEGAKSNLELMKEIYEDKISLKQQLTSAESQLANAEQQLASARERYNQAEINFEQAEREYERMQYLYEEKVITEKQFEGAESQYKNAKSSLNTAQIGLEQAKIGYNTAQQSYKLTEQTFNNPTQLKQQLENARSQVKSAQAGLAVAEANLEQVKKGATQEQLNASLAQVKQAEAGLEQAKLSLENSIVKSPIKGVVSAVRTEAGEIISPGQPIVTVIDIDQLYLEVSVTAATMSRLQEGDQVRIIPEAIKNEELTAKIDTISPEADPASKNFPVKMLVDNSAHQIKPGMFADAVFSVQSAENTLVVPISTIVGFDSTEPHVYIVEDNKAVKKAVKIGIVSDNLVELVSGVEENDQIILKGQNRLSDGEEVEVIN
ncbi:MULTISPECIES: efflux RND transporter periplasmic adaptor subunit [Halanaerobium]|uniref:RND family efflux transporter, MFP subunit n=1 Tax=Halanaerobium kushneri TaxID=56779 RepID=A0A1N6U7T5_9FIRM|nr:MULTISPECIES: efflux RND transporter periplasmic adaptor subunit [Halanaerobium]RCW60215.1 RND family efflux transporter MFP subunit [Halanaerobium sp. ST460_2HS_T2]SIQ61356.1 RND family efflux transporter, MFP subunit [Halanaerobium kushneri]